MDPPTGGEMRGCRLYCTFRAGFHPSHEILCCSARHSHAHTHPALQSLRSLARGYLRYATAWRKTTKIFDVNFYLKNLLLKKNPNIFKMNLLGFDIYLLNISTYSTALASASVFRMSCRLTLYFVRTPVISTFCPIAKGTVVPANLA